MFIYLFKNENKTHLNWPAGIYLRSIVFLFNVSCLILWSVNLNGQISLLRKKETKRTQKQLLAKKDDQHKTDTCQITRSICIATCNTITDPNLSQSIWQTTYTFHHIHVLPRHSMQLVDYYQTRVTYLISHNTKIKCACNLAFDVGPISWSSNNLLLIFCVTHTTHCRVVRRFLVVLSAPSSFNNKQPKKFDNMVDFIKLFWTYYMENIFKHSISNLLLEKKIKRIE